MLIDTHIHLDYLTDLPQALTAARGNGIGAWVVPGVEPARWPQLMAAVSATPGAWAAPGVHPAAASSWRPELGETLRQWARDPRTVAIGEVGLDGHCASPMSSQEELFRQMIRLARATDRPLLLHCRRATGHLLELLRSEQADQVGGIAHAFSGSLETAKQLIELGFALGIGGVVTYPEARRLADVVRAVAADWLVLESDAPDLSPHPHRGKTNRPEWMVLVADRVAELRGWSAAETTYITTANARRVLRLAPPQETSVP